MSRQPGVIAIESLEFRLQKALLQQDTYQPSAEVARQVQHVTFVALIGITGVGKSHLIPHIITKGGADFSEVGNMSTRQTRPTDHAHFRGDQSHQDLLDRIERRDLVNYAVHPSGHIYATDARSYRTDYVLLPTLASSLPQFDTLGCFKRVVPIGIITDGKTWEKRFESRADDPKLPARLEEALICLAWQKAHVGSVPMINNATGQEAETAQKIISIIRGDTPTLLEPGTLSLIKDLEQRVKAEQATLRI